MIISYKTLLDLIVKTHVHLEQDVCAHGLAVGDYGFLIFPFSIPAVQLNTPANKRF